MLAVNTGDLYPSLDMRLHKEVFELRHRANLGVTVSIISDVPEIRFRILKEIFLIYFQIKDVVCYKYKCSRFGVSCADSVMLQHLYVLDIEITDSSFAWCIE